MPATGTVMAALITTGGTLALDLTLARFTRVDDGQYSISPTDYLDPLTPQAHQGLRTLATISADTPPPDEIGQRQRPQSSDRSACRCKVSFREAVIAKCMQVY